MRRPRTCSIERLLFLLVCSAVTLPGCQSATTSTSPPAQAPVEPGFPVKLESAPVRGVASAPISLTATDGSGLQLSELYAQAIVEEPLAFTELHLSFYNPEDRVREGTFSITLPEGAAISRFAMRNGDEWKEAEVVEKQRARVTYESFLHRRQDPALLEKAAGNQFSARVFPIPPRSRKDLILSYSQELGNARPYVLPLQGLPSLAKLDVTVSRAGSAQPGATIQKTDFTPDSDIRLDPGTSRGAFGIRNGDLVLTRVEPVAKVSADPIESVLVLFDTSASRALGFEDQLRFLDDLARRIAVSSGPRTKFVVACFDQAVTPVFDGEVGSFGGAELDKIRSRTALGASNLEQAILWARKRQRSEDVKRMLLITDGVSTAGTTERASIESAVASLKGIGIERVDAVVMGGIRDEGMLQKVVTGNLPRDGIVVDSSLGTAAVERKLAQATRSGIEVKVEGATWFWPRRLNGVQAGDDALVYARVPEGQKVRVSLGETVHEPFMRTVERPLLERSWAKANIESLLDVPQERQEAAMREVVDLSKHYRVLSPHTSMLILETPQDYERFGLDPKARTDILTVAGTRLALLSPTSTTPADDGKNDVAKAKSASRDTALARAAEGDERAERRGPAPVVQREAAPAPAALPPEATPAPAPVALDQPQVDVRQARPAASPPPPPPAPTRPGAFGTDSETFGALGLMSPSDASNGGGGHGEGTGNGLGSGHGRLGGTHRDAAPRIQMGSVQVSGRLPPEVIQRIVRQNYGRFRLCYERGLRTNPRLDGRVAVRFIIAANGSVVSATNAGSTLPDPTTVACIVQSFRGLEFPSPESGIISVVYPLTFSPNGQPIHGPQAQPSSNTHWEPSGPRIDAYTGRFKSVMDQLGAGGVAAAMKDARDWHEKEPGDVMALVALGEAFEANKDPGNAARAYGSIIDLFPGRADLRRFAGERLERLPAQTALDVAIDTYAKAEIDRPDHPASHRLLAFALLKKGDYDSAWKAAVRGLEQQYPSDRFRGVDQILREDLGLIAAAWIKVEPKRESQILEELRRYGGTLENAPSLRFVLNWETDANDVDFHISDAEGNHAYYAQPRLATGGNLYADVTTGYGPECFTVRLPNAQRSKAYKLEAHYFSRGPMGYGMGKLQVVDHDGKGSLSFDERPFVVMADRAYVALGTVQRSGN